LSITLPPCISNIGNEAGIDGPQFHCNHPACLGEYRLLGLACHRRRLAARQHIFLQGDPQNQVYLVTSGAVRLYKLLQNGRRQIMGFKFAGDFISFDREPIHRFDAQAITPTELRSFPTAAFYAAAGNDARFLLKLYNAVSSDLSRVHDLALTIGQRDAEGSMAAFLLDIDARIQYRSADGFLSLPMLRGDIADYVGLTHETVSRIFTQLKKSGLIALRGRSGVRLLNRPALRALADGISGDRIRRTVDNQPLLRAQ
jgi:CRP-like cAMP-binding protein